MSKFGPRQHRCELQNGTFKHLATIDIARRIESTSDDRKSLIHDKLNAIPNRIDDTDYLGRGKIPQSMQYSLAKIHGLITYWELEEATTIIEFAIWKCNIHIAFIQIIALQAFPFFTKNDNAGNETRQRIRRHCGREMQVIMTGVLQFFDYNTGDE